MVFVVRDLNKKDTAFDLFTNLSHGRIKQQTGDVGLEIEVEGIRLPHGNEGLPSPWRYYEDGSLRGEENAEYVLKAPIPFKKVGDVLDSLWAKFTDLGSQLDDSNRTSVHVHLNVQPFFLNRLTAFISLYYVFEDILTQWCGDNRVGNLFCLRAKDAPAILTMLRKFIQTDMRWKLNDNLHYAGLNPNAMAKFGSLEFRPMRGTPDKTLILRWVRILERLYKLSAEFPDPRDVCYGFSGDGPLNYFRNALGEEAELVQNEIGWSDEKVRESLYEGIRLAQDLCFCRDWSSFQPVEVMSDPFGRAAHKVAQKLHKEITAPTINPTPVPSGMSLLNSVQYVPMASPTPTTSWHNLSPEDAEDWYPPVHDEDEDEAAFIEPDDFEV